MPNVNPMTPKVGEVNGVYYYHNNHPLVQELCREYLPTNFGHCIWTSSFVLMEYILRYPPPPGQKILIPGCGWSVIVPFAIKRLKGEVLAFDIDPATLPLLSAVCKLNHVTHNFLVSSFEDVQQDVFDEMDLILGADIVYYKEHTEQNCNMVEKLVKKGHGRAVLCSLTNHRLGWAETLDGLKKRAIEHGWKYTLHKRWRCTNVGGNDGIRHHTVVDIEVGEGIKPEVIER